MEITEQQERCKRVRDEVSPTFPVIYLFLTKYNVNFHLIVYSSQSISLEYVAEYITVLNINSG